jgi:glycosyltransferase involved in cell wall biosynthesis
MVCGERRRGYPALVAMRILYVEPFHGGSHAAFGRVLMTALPAQWTKVTLPGRHWKWRMRGGAVYAALERKAELAAPHDLLLASSYLPLAELVGLVPALAAVPRILYFHENQLAYPHRDGAADERDHHFGFTQLVSALAATRCLFNSRHNLDSFLAHGEALLARMPDAVPRGFIETIRARSEVLPVPLDVPDRPPTLNAPDREERRRGPIILWNHRWEHDKDPDAFFDVLFELADRGVAFRLAVCGERFSRWPPVFDEAARRLVDRVVHFGFLPDRAAYESLLSRAHIAVSTAAHEFFGVAMLEAVHFGARPLVPDRLAYPELFESAFRYRDRAELVRTLTALCGAFVVGDDDLRADRRAITSPFMAAEVAPRYARCFDSVVGGGGVAP